MLSVVAAVALALALAEHRLAPLPSAEPARGTEEAFSRVPFRRTLGPRQPPGRWTRGHDAFRFCGVPGPATLRVLVAPHVDPIQVASAGHTLGTVAAGQPEAAFALPAGGRCFDVELTAALRQGGPPGARLQALRVEYERSWWPGVMPWVLLTWPALVVGFCASRAGFGRLAAGAFGIAAAVLRTAALWPGGLRHSAYNGTLALLLTVTSILALAFAMFCERRAPARARAAFLALLAAGLVQGVAATSPTMVVSDLLFHVHKLQAVVAGDYFPVSVTQHGQPFTIPYGVSFYATLIPFVRAGFDPIVLVRAGAGLAGIAASVGLFLLVAPRGAGLAAAAVVLFQLLPANFDAYSYGNFSHAFGHAMALLFFAWWAGRRPGGWAIGALLLAVGATAHLAVLITLVCLCSCLAVLQGRELVRDRTRLVALAVGFAVAALYYARFVPLVMASLGQMGQGSGQTGLVRPFVERLWFEMQWARLRWGLPAILLALFAAWRARAALDRPLCAFWLAGGVLALAALFSPLDVRYLYALTPAVALTAAAGATALAARGGAGRVAAGLLLAGQAAVGLANVIEAVYIRYRP